MRLGLVLALCLVSAAVGAGIDHYWTNLGNLLSTKQSEAVQTTPPPSEQNKAEVLGDRVRCDVRFGELHLPTPHTGRFLTDAWELRHVPSRKRNNQLLMPYATASATISTARMMAIKLPLLHPVLLRAGPM